MSVTAFYCAECKRTQSVELRVGRSVDATNFYDEPRSTIIEGVQTFFTCGHIQTVWDVPITGIG